MQLLRRPGRLFDEFSEFSRQVQLRTDGVTGRAEGVSTKPERWQGMNTAPAMCRHVGIATSVAWD